MLERLRLSRFSGSYKLKSAELAQDTSKNQTISVQVWFLDETTHHFQIKKRAKGSSLLEQIFTHLELSEKDYFSLQFVQKTGGDVVQWIDPNKQFRKQWNKIRERDATTPVLQFRVKFYVTDPSRLLEEYTRYHFYLQIKRDIFDGKLTCPLNTACLLASYTVQSELGDFNPDQHVNGYLSSMQLLAEQTEEAERRICELHKLHRGQLPADAEYNYLEHAKKLYKYGVDLHDATDSTGKSIQLGITSIGLVVFKNNIRINVFSWSKIVKISFKRKEFFIQLSRELSENYDTMLGFHMGSHKNAKVLWKSCVEHHSFFRLEQPNRLHRFPFTLGSKFYYSGRTELQTVQESRQRGRIAKVFTRSPSKRLIGSPQLTNSSSDSKSSTNQPSLIQRSYRSHDNKVTSIPSDQMPRKAWEQQSDDEGGFIEHCAKTYDPIQLDLYKSRLVDSPLAADENLVTVRLIADEQGRFGFNVRGGTDLNAPILISRVAPFTPADRTIPKICEGDQVIMINGRDVNGLTHEQVVSLIKSSTEFRTGELVLTVKQNALVSFTEEEPLFQYVPENGIDHPPLNGVALFTQSLLLLHDGLASGALITQYDQLYRKNPDYEITEAKKPANLNKNRYRDISPYDCTRVVLINSNSGDYINANYVNMEIPTGQINRYIATQGPLPSTTTDFWRMVQQESSHIIVMLTTVMERGRPKCHQYWPPAGEQIEMSRGLAVRCTNECADETGSFVFRDLILTDELTGERRQIRHLQYLAWPDHGVPSDPNLFLEFTDKVRSARKTTLLEEIDESLKRLRIISMDADEVDDVDVPATVQELNGTDDSKSSDDSVLPPSTSVHQLFSAANPPLIVHCSAGIGRTGVLILMETALSLIDANEPVYPLDIVQAMRDQRACMIQNVSQYRFVCECICSAYAKLTQKKDQEP